MFREAGTALKPLVGASTLVVSIMAGTPIAALREVCGGSVVRAMPNTPGRDRPRHHGGGGGRQRQRRAARHRRRVVRATGSVEWVDEERFDGRGDRGIRFRPGLYLPARRGDRARRRRGRPAGELATKLARETVAGSGELLHRSENSSATLRKNVTSPGGTTAAALEVLMGDGGMQQLMIRAVAAATKRSKELAK